MTKADRGKRSAARRAVEFVRPGMALGLGTGSTARHALDALADRIRRGELSDIVGVPTSRETEAYARELELPVASLEDEPRPDLVLDGADEVDPALDLIKGLGGALLWEKIVATAGDRLVIMVDDSKLVDRLGERAPLPLEVVPFGWTTHLPYLEALGCSASLRTDESGGPFVTDSGHYIVDCGFSGGIDDAERLDRELNMRPGVVETGLFAGLANAVVIGEAETARVVRRGERP